MFRFFWYEIKNRRIYNMYFLILDEYLYETETALSLQFSFDIFAIIYKKNCFIYVIFIARCEPNLYVCIY
jgi:hypothetical protein